jgi:hypothetical protein
MDDILSCLEWRDHSLYGLRIEKAKQIGKKYFDQMESNFELIRAQFEEVGIFE